MNKLKSELMILLEDYYYNESVDHCVDDYWKEKYAEKILNKLSTYCQHKKEVVK